MKFIMLIRYKQEMGDRERKRERARVRDIMNNVSGIQNRKILALCLFPPLRLALSFSLLRLPFPLLFSFLFFSSPPREGECSIDNPITLSFYQPLAT